MANSAFGGEAEPLRHIFASFQTRFVVALVVANKYNVYVR